MGENPKHVYNYGSLSLENINKLKKIELKSIEKEYKFKFKKSTCWFAIILKHSVLKIKRIFYH